MSLNLGPFAITLEHADEANLAGGICLVHSGGRYNSKKGGQIYLRELKLVIEFPSNSLMGFPSAIIRHGNLATAEGETRTSVTQYAAAGLFHWVDFGFCTSEVSAKKDPAKVQRLKNDSEGRWRRALERFSKVDKLHEDRALVFHS